MSACEPPSGLRARLGETAILRGLALTCAIALAAMLTVVAATPAQATYARIVGEGSSWAANAIDAMRVDVREFGITVDYNPSGSSSGRRNWLRGIVDFAVSDIPFQFEPEDGSPPESPDPGSYAYIPATAGGTAFMYNLHVDGQRVTNLRLSGENVAKIFTGVITRWNDPAIAADNPGIGLPDRQVVPVVRSDGAGTTVQLTEWMTARHGTIWQDYCQLSGRAPACGPTQYYPTVPGMVAQSGDAGVAGYVSQPFAEGAIGYVNYSYARTADFPVAKVLNAAGYYTEPTPENVAVSLLAATVNDDPSDLATYLTAELGSVYTNPDPRTYELSSYAYFILPMEVRGSFTEDKGRTLGAFTYHAMCQAQQQSASLGYSPIPINLVEAAFEHIRRIPGVEPQQITIEDCRNPTFSPDGTNLVVQNAPYPQPCDQQGPVQCGDGTAPSPPVLDGLVPDPGQLTATFTSTGGDTFVVEASIEPGFGTVVATGTGTSSPIAITGLSDGTEYHVRVFASDESGTSLPSNVLSATPGVNCGSVQGLTIVRAVDGDVPVLDVDFDPPASVSGCPPPSGFVVDVEPGGVVAQPSPAGDATSARIAGVNPGDEVTVTVTPQFAAGFVGVPAAVSTTVAENAVVIQDIDVTRPVGALVLTQICGAHGTLPGEPASLGFADGLGPRPATFSSTVGTPLSPGAHPSLTPPTETEDGSDLDPRVAEYPYPTDANGVAAPAAETHCGVDMGVAEFVTRGAGAGQYFAAHGAMSQVTIVDTRNVDAGWVVTGTASDFAAHPTVDDGAGVDAATDEFSGDHLGWTPVVTDDTGPFRLGEASRYYDQEVIPGPPVTPVSGTMTVGATLASAPAFDDSSPVLRGGLGIAVLDARLKLLIPVTSDAGSYEATLRVAAL